MNSGSIKARVNNKQPELFIKKVLAEIGLLLVDEGEEEGVLVAGERRENSREWN